MTTKTKAMGDVKEAPFGVVVSSGPAVVAGSEVVVEASVVVAALLSSS